MDTPIDPLPSYRTRTEGWALWQHALLLMFYVSVVLGILAFIAFDISILISATGDWPGDGRDFAVLVGIGFLLSLQAGWCYLAWQIHCRERPLKAASIAILPLLLTSLPFGAITYSEWNREPPHPTPDVY